PVKEVTISRHASNWYVSFRIEVSSQTTEKPFDVVGVDLGILRFATLSVGEYPDSPKPLRTLGKKLSKKQWRDRNKQIDSRNWRKAQDRIAKLHKHIADARKTYIHGLTSYLAKNHSMVVIEDLNVKGMMQNRRLAKVISDCGFYEFKRQLEYKTELYGSRLKLASRWFPSSKLCSSCGTKKECLPLSERTFKCSCGFECDRDLNAAINLSQIGVLHPEFTPVDKYQPPDLVEAGINQNTGS
ncbi:MAG TPA: RNA-guided endonuclease TnpB family protein, partial [Coleofasciculaceae cyanobacterium]